jgi:hypothetical protein
MRRRTCNAPETNLLAIVLPYADSPRRLKLRDGPGRGRGLADQVGRLERTDRVGHRVEGGTGAAGGPQNREDFRNQMFRTVHGPAERVVRVASRNQPGTRSRKRMEELRQDTAKPSSRKYVKRKPCESSGVKPENGARSWTPSRSEKCVNG